MRKENYLLIIGGMLLLAFFLGTVLIANHKFKTRPAEDNSKRVNSLPSLVLSPAPASASASPKEERPVYTGFCLNVPVLMYHHVAPKDIALAQKFSGLNVDNNTFAEHLSYLNAHGYTSISALTLIEALINKQPLGKSVVVTIDDGYADIKDYAFLLAQKYNIKLNLMIPSGLINNTGYLTWGQLKDMIGSGLVTAYDHTWSHVNLGNADQEKIKSEILTAKKQLEENLGGSVNIFAFPYGSGTDAAINILRENNFIAAFSTLPGTIQCDSFLFGLHRTRIGNAPLSAYGL